MFQLALAYIYKHFDFFTMIEIIFTFIIYFMLVLGMLTFI
jgi:hypothetical protein